MTALFVVAVELYKVFIRSRPWFESLGCEKEPVSLEGSNDTSGAGSEIGEGTREQISKV